MTSSAFRFQECRREARYLPDNDDMIYFAVGCDAERSWPNLSWVAKNFAEQKICFLHILQPTKMIPSKNEPRVSEKQRVQEVLKEYHRMLRDSGLRGGGDVYLKMQKIEDGIVMLISRLNIKNLVMGAAASTEMVYIRSKITGYVSQNAPATCQIWFVNGGYLIKTRFDQMITVGSFKNETSSDLLWRQKTEEESREAKNKMDFSSQHEELELKSTDATTVNALASDWGGGVYASTSSQPSTSRLPSSSASFVPSAPSVVNISHMEESEEETPMQTFEKSGNILRNSSQLDALNEGALYDELYEKLEVAMTEVETSKREAFEESKRRQKVERDAVGASRKAKAAEIKMNSQLVAALREKSLLENEITDYKMDNNRLTEKITLSVEMMKMYKNERDELKATLDRTKEMNRLAGESSRSTGASHKFLCEFSCSEIEDATSHFDHSPRIDERGHWVIYKGILHHTEVDIKLMDAEADSSKGHSEYWQEVEALSRLRHPNIVTLIGICREAMAIIYEHTPNGSLEDRLICENNSSPLPWQTRISIAAELCSVLVFLHSNKSHSTVHGDLKLANILLDANFNVKLSHFGLSHTMTTSDQSTPIYDVGKWSKVLSSLETQRAVDDGYSTPSSNITSAASWKMKPSDTFVYKDLESVTPELDIYSFGIILLRLLTGREAYWGLAEEVQVALDNGNLDSLLDSLAGDWPYIQAQQLAKIALRCSAVSRNNRPDLESHVIGVLKKMTASCQGSQIGSPPGGEVHSQAPPYYICPISQDVMEDPHVAADGFTYEKDGIQGWLNSGHNTSPMTNLKLENSKLVPNRTLRSAIQEWRLHL